MGKRRGDVLPQEGDLGSLRRPRSPPDTPSYLGCTWRPSSPILHLHEGENSPTQTRVASDR